MAARENQGYMIGVILLVLLSVVLAITTYLGISKANEYADQASSANKRLRGEVAVSNSLKAQVNILKAYVGIEGSSVADVGTNRDIIRRNLAENLSEDIKQQLQQVDDDIGRIATVYDTDMRRFSNLPPDMDATYRKLVDEFVKTNADLHNQIAVTTNRMEQGEREKQAELQSMQASLDQARQERDTAQNDLNAAKERFAQSERRFTQEAENTRRRLDETTDLARREQDRLNVVINQLTSDNTRLEQTNRELQARLQRFEVERYEIPDGRIVSVAPTIDMVYINLGSADHLRTNQRFAVYDQKMDHFERGRQKAMIEVTKVLGPHLAEARITDAHLMNPILTNDYVVTSTWEPGYAVPVAIVGFIDMNNDGRSDLERLISVIEANGGKVVAYQLPDGKIEEREEGLNEKTRFIVRGGTAGTSEGNRAMNEMLAKAQQFNVQVVSIREMLNSMGVRMESPIQRMDGRGAPQQFEPRQPPRRSSPQSAYGN